MTRPFRYETDELSMMCAGSGKRPTVHVGKFVVCDECDEMMRTDQHPVTARVPEHIADDKAA